MDRNGRVGFWPWMLCWALTALAFIARSALTAGTTPLIVDTDDAMRLTMVHDFLGGQGWFDLVQHRLNTPFGGEIHWSRLIDAPEAALLWLMRLLLFGANADIAAAYAWPLLLLGLLLALTGRLALRLGGRAAVLPALLLPALSLITMAEFAPGRFDHHGAQILLTLAMLGCVIAALERPRFAVGAGIAAAVALAIGIEGLPMVAVTVAVFGLSWVASPRQAVAMRDFGLSFSIGTALALAQGVPPARWFVPMFDAISIVYALAAILTGLALLLLSLMPLRTWPLRLAAGAIAGIVVVGLVVSLYPNVLEGPYGLLDPWLIANWIDRISEAEPWIVSLVGEPVYPIAVLVPAMTAIAFAVTAATRNRPLRAAWLIYAAFLAVAIAIMLLQIRGARIAAPLSVPGCAVLIATVWERYGSGRGVLNVVAVLGSWIISAGVIVALIATTIVLAFPDYADATTDKYLVARQACLMPAAFVDLAGLPPERIMAPIDLGSHLLLFTPHAVVAAPYHRNAEAVLDAFRFFNEPIEAGRKILAARGIGLVVICPAMKEIRGLVDHTPDSFVSLYAAGRLPPWLVNRSLPGSPLQIYAVTAD
jgi:hypothetical protein